MTDISASSFVSVDERVDSDQDTIVTSVLSALLVIGLPASFWIALIELANYALSLGIAPDTRFTIGAVIVGLLALIWCFVAVSARQRKSRQLEAQLKSSN